MMLQEAAKPMQRFEVGGGGKFYNILYYVLYQYCHTSMLIKLDRYKSY